MTLDEMVDALNLAKEACQNHGWHAPAERLDLISARLRETANHEALAETVRDKVLWIDDLLESVESRTVYDAKGNPSNGFGFVAVTDWKLRQKRDELKAALAATQPPTEEQPSRIKRELAVALKLYAKARKITIDEATENVRDAVDINTTEETDGKSHVD